MSGVGAALVAGSDVAALVQRLGESAAWRDDLRAFWAVYDLHLDTIAASDRSLLGTDPELGEPTRTLGPEDLHRRVQEVRILVRGAALDGDWVPYLAVLAARTEGAIRAGVSLTSCAHSVTSLRSLIVPLLSAAHGADAAGLSAALRGMDAYLDVTRAAIGEAYLLAVRRQAAQREDEAAALADAARVLAEGTLAGATLGSILDAAMRVVPSRVVAVMVPRDEGVTLEIAAVAGISETWVGHRYPVSSGISGRAFRTGEVQLVGDVHEDPDYLSWLPGIRSHLVVPLRSQGWVVGLLNLEAEEVGRYGEAELRLMQAFAAHAAAALEIDRLLQERSGRERDLQSALNEAGALALATRSLAAEAVSGDVLQGILAAAQLAVPAKHAILVVADRATRELEVAAVVGAPVSWVGRREGLSEGVIARAFRTAEVQLVPDVRKDPDYDAWSDGMGSELAVPIVSRGQAVGVINLESPELASFGPREAFLMRSFAEYAAIALENERLLHAQRESEREARRQLDYVQRILEVTDGVYVVDRHGDLAFMNAAAERALGWRADELRGRNMHDTVHFQRADGTRVSRADCPLGHVTSQVATYRSEDDVLTRKDGSTVPVAYTATSLVRDGEISGAVIAFRDLTERRSLEELARRQAVLEEASRAKSAFLSNMSHELRTPLNAVLGFTALLEERLDASLPERQRRYLDNIREAGQHLMALIDDVLDLARVEAGRLDLRREPVALEVLLEPVAAAAGISAASRGLRFDMTGLPHGHVHVDAGKLRQVLYNLVSNAVKFTLPGGRVELQTIIEGRGVGFTVADSGIGIPADKRDRVFGVFERLHEGSIDVAGTGLGLALTKRLVELHGGDITFESVEGAGTTFRVWIPDVVQTAPAPALPH